MALERLATVGLRTAASWLGLPRLPGDAPVGGCLAYSSSPCGCHTLSRQAKLVSRMVKCRIARLQCVHLSLDCEQSGGEEGQAFEGQDDISKHDT